MNIKSIILSCRRPTRVDSTREDPSSGGHGGFDQAFPEHLLEFGLEVEVLETSVYGDEQGGQLQLPVLHHQMQEVVRLGVIGDPNILERKRKARYCDLFQTTLSLCSVLHVAETHHGLVDESSTLELD